MKKNESRLEVRLPAELRDEIQQAARRKGVTITDYVRDTLRRSVRRSGSTQ